MASIEPSTSCDAGYEPPEAHRAAGARASWFARQPLSRRIMGVIVLLLGVLYCGDAVLLTHFYRATAARQQEARDARATLLAEHASRALAAVDLSLETIIDKLGDGLDGKPTVFAQMVLDDHIRRLPQVRAFIVLDRHGIRILDSREYPPRWADLSDRPYFIEQQRWRGVGLYIDALRISRADGKPFFGLSRPVLDSDGGLRGVVAALVEPSYFSTFYGTHQLDEGEEAVLARDDGALLVGSVSDAASSPGVPPTLQDVLARRAGDDVIKRPVPSFPLDIVLVGPPASATSTFRSFVISDALVMVTMSLLAFWLARVLGRQAAARELAESRLRDAIESAPAGFAMYGADDRLVLANELYRSIFDRIGHLVVPGTPFPSIVEGAIRHHQYDLDGPDAAADWLAARLDAHRLGNGELVQKLVNGRWLLVRERRTKEGGVLCFFTDITPMKQQEEALRRSEQAERAARERAEEANRAKSAFLATMSHELRTPLNAVIGFSEMIEREVLGPLNPRYRDYCGLIRKSGEHLLAIINDILDIAKLQSGKTELHLEPVALAAIIDDAARLVEAQAAAAGLRVSVEAEADLGLMADRLRLRQILLNLLSNAIKFTPSGGSVRVVARRVEGGAQIEVIDTGIGMAAEDMPRALEPFGQVANALVRENGGTGLGLPLSKSLVEHHGGRLDIASAPQAGTTVRLFFPEPLLTRVDGDAAGRDQPPAEGAA